MKGQVMKQENRVLGRKGARELMAREVEEVTAAIRISTNTACLLNVHGAVFSDSAPADPACGSDHPF
jgi:hypothetical protein